MPAALVLLLATSVQAPVARWTPELAFSVKRVGSVAISPDGRWAAVEVSEPIMEAEPSEWRTSVYVYTVGDAGQGQRDEGAVDDGDQKDAEEHEAEKHAYEGAASRAMNGRGLGRECCEVLHRAEGSREQLHT